MALCGQTHQLVRQVCALAARQLLISWAGKPGAAIGRGGAALARGEGQRRGMSFFSRSVPRGHKEQADFLRELNLRGKAEEVVSHFESGNVATSEGTLAEYVKALVKMEALDGSALLRTLERGANGIRSRMATSAGSYASRNGAPRYPFSARPVAQPAARSAAEAAPRQSEAAELLTNAAAFGTQKNPIHVLQVGCKSRFVGGSTCAGVPINSFGTVT
eukprot:evm.model.scf_1519.1 EVM.evm.TU.scf_1519.1   scf_1519:690-3215(-)